MQKRYRPPREYLLFIASFIISVLCRYLSLYEINSRYMHLNEVFCLFAFLPKRIAQEALLTKEPTSHTTVRTDRYTAVQPHKCKDSYRSRMLQYPACTSLSFVMVFVSVPLPAIAQYPFREFPFLQACHFGIPNFTRFFTLVLGSFLCFQIQQRNLLLSHSSHLCIVQHKYCPKKWDLTMGGIEITAYIASP